uniref:Uncharacterized protein n=1 Tax=Anguilla anguilla TaxID=7936 RepID=A0A0E9UY38_ANGAN
MVPDNHLHSLQHSNDFEMATLSLHGVERLISDCTSVPIITTTV